MGDQPRVPHIAILVYMTKVEGDYARPRYSEDVVLIHAPSVEAARTIAEALGREESAAYKNVYDETVTWSFVGVADVRGTLYDTLQDDITLYSRSFDDLGQYREIFSFSSLTESPAGSSDTVGE
jgi:hypothetical protein